MYRFMRAERGGRARIGVYIYQTQHPVFGTLSKTSPTCLDRALFTPDP